MQGKDYYQILEVSRNSDGDEIHKSYLRLAKLWHPDKNQDKIELATENFKLIQKAYETLTDEKQKAEYNKANPTEEEKAKKRKEQEAKRKSDAVAAAA
ncbi:MAG: hypothetical protein EZS28_004965 [Streblomastix strix]|uniref:J domain-containing protein n=1 Tax=Streblomastix strix TaxID=222440 RepID=A0A5J4WWT4_9EUKA|nr:MAG: hypothetical protein EZS28_004965 [Streblomastix strix]